MMLNVGLSRKVGEANYGSRGASVNLEVEVESDLVREPGQLHEKIRYLFRLAKQSVDNELNGAGGSDAAVASNTEGNGQNGHVPTGNGRRATQSQVRAIHAIANRRRIDLAALLGGRYQVNQPDDLSIGQASELIDEMKSAAGGTGGSK